MLAAQRYTSRFSTRGGNVIHESWQRWDTADEEGHQSPPVRGESRRVPVDAVEVVHVWHRDVASPHEIVVRDEDGSHGTKKDGVPTQERQELSSRSQDLPRDEGPRADESGEELTAADVDIAWAEGHQVVRGADGVRRDVDA